MLLACALARNYQFINSVADFDSINGKDALVVSQNIRFAYFQQVTLKNVQLDCLSHVIAAETPPFEIVVNVTIRNCVFHLKTGMSADFNSSALINSKIVSTGSAAVFQRIYASILTSVRSSTAASFAVGLINSTVVGCAFQHNYEGADSVPALFNSINSSVFQNSFFNISVSTKNQMKVAGLAMMCSATDFFRVRAIANITAQLEKPAQQAAGLVAECYQNVNLSEADFVVYMHVSYFFDAVGGILACSRANSITVCSISAVAAINVGAVDSLSGYLTFNNVGGFAADLRNTSVDMRRVSYFVDIAYNKSFSELYTNIAGLLVYCSKPRLALTDCYVFGTIAVYNFSGASQQIAGLQTGDAYSTQLNACSFIGKIICDIRQVRNTLISSFGTGFSNAAMHNCVVNCNISVNTTNTRELEVSGMLSRYSSGKVVSSAVSCGISVNSTSSQANVTIGGFVSGTTNNVEIDCSTGEILVQYVQVSEISQIRAITLMFAEAAGDAMNCSVRGSIEVISACLFSHDCQIAGIMTPTSRWAMFSDVVVTGSITAPGSFRMASGFGSLIERAFISNVVIAIAFPGLSGVNVSSNLIYNNYASNLFVDCGLDGNNGDQEYCRSELRSQAAADALGAGFGWKMEYNGAYPYLLSLPAWDGAKYVLPASGPFSAGFYYVDGLGYPFLRTNYQICRGACYGVYESPLVRNCTGNSTGNSINNTTNNTANNTTNNNNYCIQPELAETDFQTASCIHENAHCNAGASICTSESELKLNQTDSTYICELGCPGCVNGHCQNNTCVCNLYHSGDNCSTYQCRNDSPACFGDPTMECAADGSKCVPTDACVALGCVHGSCVVNSSSNKTQCRCDNMWTGSRCDRCNAYGPECSVSQPECNKLCGEHGHCGTPLTTICTCSLGFGGANCGGCAAGHTAVGDKCVCGDSSGPCQLRQTCVDGVCVADCLLADAYCAECEVADQSVCARCVKQHTIQNGICQFHLSAAVSTSFAVVLGVAAAVAAALGAVLLFRLLSAKKNGGKQKPVGDGVKLDAVQSGPKSVGKAEKPLLEQVPAMQDVNIEIGIDSARDGK